MLTIRRKCTICGGDGVDKENTQPGGGGAISCPSCKGIGYFEDDTIDVIEIMTMLDDIHDTLDDVMDKCNDIFEEVSS